MNDRADVSFIGGTERDARSTRENYIKGLLKMLFRYPQLLNGIFAAVMLVAFSAHNSALADEADEGNIKISGFVSLVGGQASDARLDDGYSGQKTINGLVCPCYVADWSNAGLYNRDLAFKPESRAGIQLNYVPTSEFSLSGQIVTRGTNSDPDVTWAYGGYKFSKGWEVQVGRKRIPLYYYSDFQDIGVSYPWVSPPPELYGWDITNYNGGSIRYAETYDNTSISASVFAGSESIDKSLYWKIYNSNHVKVSWNNILGSDLEINRGPLTVRGVYMTADVSTSDSTGSVDPYDAKLTAYGIALNIDLDKWFVLSEVSKLSRYSSTPGYSYEAPAATIGAGVRLGRWTPFINFAQYIENAKDEAYVPASFRRTSVTLRYDVEANSSVKFQIDRNEDITNNLGGTVTLYRISYDRVF